MKGKIISHLGNEIIVSVTEDSAKTMDLKTAKKLYGKTASVDNSNVGKVFDIIGRTESPYVVVKLFKVRNSNRQQSRRNLETENIESNIIGKSVII